MINHAQSLQDPFALLVRAQRRYMEISGQVTERCAVFHATLAATPELGEKGSLARSVITGIDHARQRRRAREIGVSVAPLAAHAAKIHHECLIIAQDCLLSSHNSLHRFREVLAGADPASVERIAVSLAASVAALRQAIANIDTVIATDSQRALQIKCAAANVARLAQLV